MNIISRYRDVDNIVNSSETDNNNVNKANRFNKQNREQQNDYNQQFFVIDFFLIICDCYRITIFISTKTLFIKIS